MPVWLSTLLQLVLLNCKSVLSQTGKIAVLIGGYSDRGRYQPLPQLLVERATREGLWPACTEIIRLQHGNTSSRKRYRSSFIPGLHDTCLVFEAVGKAGDSVGNIMSEADQGSLL